MTVFFIFYLFLFNWIKTFRNEKKEELFSDKINL